MTWSTTPRYCASSALQARSLGLVTRNFWSSTALWRCSLIGPDLRLHVQALLHLLPLLHPR